MDIKYVVSIIAIITPIASILGAYFASKSKTSSAFVKFNSRLDSIENEIGRERSIIYGEQGRLNVIDVQTCKHNIDQIYSTIRRHEKVVELLITKLDDLNKNVLLISFKMDSLSGKDKSEG